MCTRVKRHMLTKKQYPLLFADECALRVARLLPSLCMFAIELARLVWFLFLQRERTRNKTRNFGIPKNVHQKPLRQPTKHQQALPAPATALSHAGASLATRAGSSAKRRTQKRRVASRTAVTGSDRCGAPVAKRSISTARRALGSKTAWTARRSWAPLVAAKPPTSAP